METSNIVRENFVYTHCYWSDVKSPNVFLFLSEENVWKLCESLKGKLDLNELHVVFISNAIKQIPLWCQKSSKNHSQPVLWDYHVILIYERNTDVEVFDFDTTLNFPCSLQEYARKALQSEKNFVEAFRRYFCIVPAPYFLKTFASDRSHMKDKNGEWLQPPPEYPLIRTQDNSMNLFEFIDMSQNNHGLVVDMKNLLRRFHCDVDWLES